MGTHFKKAVVPIRVNRVLHVWHKDAKKRLKLGSHGVSSDGSERSNTSSGSRSRSKLTVVEERIRSIREDSLSGGSGGDLSSPMSVIMEEGSLSPEDRTATSSHSWKIGVASSSQPAISSPPSTTFQNVWDRWMQRKSSSGRRKLARVDAIGLQIDNSKEQQQGVSPSTPGSELRRRVAHNDAVAAADVPPLQVHTTTPHTQFSPRQPWGAKSLQICSWSMLQHTLQLPEPGSVQPINISLLLLINPPATYKRNLMNITDQISRQFSCFEFGSGAVSGSISCRKIGPSISGSVIRSLLLRRLFLYACEAVMLQSGRVISFETWQLSCEVLVVENSTVLSETQFFLALVAVDRFSWCILIPSCNKIVHIHWLLKQGGGEGFEIYLDPQIPCCVIF